jgi:hypothetical protein
MHIHEYICSHTFPCTGGLSSTGAHTYIHTYTHRSCLACVRHQAHTSIDTSTHMHTHLFLHRVRGDWQPHIKHEHGQTGRYTECAHQQALHRELRVVVRVKNHQPDVMRRYVQTLSVCLSWLVCLFGCMHFALRMRGPTMVAILRESN